MQQTKTSRLYSDFYRNGPSHRDGADVTFRDIVKIFGFKTVTVGKWVTKEEQQIAANLFFDALCDLSDILAVPERVISLNGTLSLAFGSGGQKHSSAHYESNTRTLALAKNAGGGALAHEWFHAFDHYIAGRMFEKVGGSQFASAAWLDNEHMIEHALNSKLSHCFEQMFLGEQPDTPSNLVINSIEIDKALNIYYYAQPQEMAARCFESVIQDNSIKNAFLVQGTKQSQEAKLGVYPNVEQRHLLHESLLVYFHTLGKALRHQSQK